MCRPEKFIRLCTCINKAPSPEACWELYEASVKDEMRIVGSFVQPNEMPLTRDLIEEKIRTDLNSENAFDFDYDPADGDRIHISVGDERFSFIYRRRSGETSSLSGNWEAECASWVEAMGRPKSRGEIKIVSD
jgi:hypothetical protein